MDAAWREVETAWRDNMERYGVRLPAENTANRLWLSILWLHRGEEIHKQAIAKVVTHLRPDLFGDQQVRHLKSQGWRDIGGRRGWHRIDFTGVNPDWLIRQTRRGAAIPAESWEEVKARYDFRCAWCRVREGEAHWFNSAVTRLQQGHKDPARPLTVENSSHCASTTTKRCETRWCSTTTVSRAPSRPRRWWRAPTPRSSAKYG